MTEKQAAPPMVNAGVRDEQEQIFAELPGAMLRSKSFNPHNIVGYYIIIHTFL